MFGQGDEFFLWQGVVKISKLLIEVHVMLSALRFVLVDEGIITATRLDEASMQVRASPEMKDACDVFEACERKLAEGIDEFKKIDEMFTQIFGKENKEGNDTNATSK